MVASEKTPDFEELGGVSVDYTGIIRECEFWEKRAKDIGENRLFLQSLRCRKAIVTLLARAEEAENRVRDLDTTHRTEMCESGYDCVELGNVRKAMEEAEARAERAEKCIARIKNAVDDHRWHLAVAAVKAFYIEKES